MALNIGDKAPEFTVNDQDGNAVSLSDYKGKKVILYFYPKDNTPGCTAQACNLRDNHNVLKKDGYVVLGISTDSQKKHQNFINKYELPFTLLADTDRVVHELYDTWQEKQMFGKKYMGTVRTTFIIDEKGFIKSIINNVKTQEHTEQILNTTN